VDSSSDPAPKKQPKPRTKKTAAAESSTPNQSPPAQPEVGTGPPTAAGNGANGTQARVDPVAHHGNGGQQDSAPAREHRDKAVATGAGQAEKAKPESQKVANPPEDKPAAAESPQEGAPKGRLLPWEPVDQ
jgi:hypothetical protein